MGIAIADRKNRCDFGALRRGTHSELWGWQDYPVLPFRVFFEFLAFFPCEEFLVFLSVLPFFSRDFRGSVEIKNPCFLGGFPGHFPRNKERKDRVVLQNADRSSQRFQFADSVPKAFPQFQCQC